MKRKILLLLMCVVMLAIGFTGCGNRSLFDTTHTFDEAIIYIPDGSIVRGKIEKWRDFEDGDQLQVTIDGVTYLTHATNVVFISY